MTVPVAALGETVAVNVIAVPEVAEVADGVTVVVVLVVPELELELPLLPQPMEKRAAEVNTTIESIRRTVVRPRKI